MNLFIVAGETSGDKLGAALINELKAQSPSRLQCSGVGGIAMREAGIESLFPLEDIAVMGFLPVIARLPTLLRRIAETAQAVIAARPDALILIDSPDFTHRVAKAVRKALPHLPIFDYVSPSVWAWRPGRAIKMRHYIDEVLALLPFEPAAYQSLHGPNCTYVGHPLIDCVNDLRPASDSIEAWHRNSTPGLVLALPGSRSSEVERLMPVFGQAFALLPQDIEITLPTTATRHDRVQALARQWSRKPRIIVNEAEKYRAFRSAHAALAASGTVTLELALAQVPTIVAYKVSALEAFIARRMIQVPTIVLPNLILGENAFPEFIQGECRADLLSRAISELLVDGPLRQKQLQALARLDQLMCLPNGQSPASRAAQIVLGKLLKS